MIYALQLFLKVPSIHKFTLFMHTHTHTQNDVVLDLKSFGIMHFFSFITGKFAFSTPTIMKHE